MEKFWYLHAVLTNYADPKVQIDEEADFENKGLEIVKLHWASGWWN